MLVRIERISMGKRNDATNGFNWNKLCCSSVKSIEINKIKIFQCFGRMFGARIFHHSQCMGMHKQAYTPSAFY